MEKLDMSIDTIIKKLKKISGNNSNLFSRKLKVGNDTLAYIYLESVSSDEIISNTILKSISIDSKTTIINIQNLFKKLENTIPGSKLKIIDNYNDMFYHLASGFTCIITENERKAIAIETRKQLDRGVTEVTSEPSVKGPKDSFTENHITNLGLIRKRIKDPNLWFEEVIVGRRTKTKVSIGYIKDVALKENVEKIKKKIENIDIDGIIDSSYIRDFIVEKKSIFPQILTTERPDMACGHLLEGKIVVLVENSPLALILPTILVDFIHASEDYYQKSTNANLTRILRVIAFIVTIITPAFFIAITNFNQEVIPNNLLISIAIQREGVPFPTIVEILLLITMFEVLRESDVRTPTAMGTSISIVGALVLGDAAVTAGIVSPIVVIIIAFTAISGLLFTDIDIINSFRWWRLLFLLGAATLGLIGFVIVFLIFITEISSQDSIGTPYLIPIAPFKKNDLKDTFTTSSRDNMVYRSSYLSKNKRRLGK